MPKRLDGWAMFKTEQYGYDKNQVSKHLAEVHQKYEVLCQENLQLKKRIKTMQEKAAADVSSC